MQPWPSPRTGCANGDENRRRAQQACLRASGDRLFYSKCAEGLAPKPYARDRSRMAETTGRQARFTRARSAKPMRENILLHNIHIMTARVWLEAATHNMWYGW